MKKLTVKDCPICGLIIWKFKMPPFIEWDENGGRINWKKRPYEMHSGGTHFWVLQTDSSRMMIAICKSCLLILDDEKVKRIFADIIFTKLSMIKGGTEKDYKLFDRIRTIEVWKWFYNEAEVVEYLETHGAKEHSTA